MMTWRLCVFARERLCERESGRKEEWVILKLQITNYGELGEATGRGSDGTTGRKGEWVILKLRITNYDLSDRATG